MNQYLRCPYLTVLVNISGERNSDEHDNDEGMEVESDISTLQDTNDIGRPSDEAPVVNLDQFKSEAARLQTFTNWPNRFIQPADLANAGFIYAGNDDLVRCVFCDQYVGNWVEDDSPIIEHRTLFPNCPFICGQDVGNVPIIFAQNLQLGVPSGSSGLASGSSSSRLSPSGVDYAGISLVAGFDETGIRPRQAFSGPEKGKLMSVGLITKHSLSWMGFPRKR